jgi:hypothetical protein
MSHQLRQVSQSQSGGFRSSIRSIVKRTTSSSSHANGESYSHGHSHESHGHSHQASEGKVHEAVAE